MCDWVNLAQINEPFAVITSEFHMNLDRSQIGVAVGGLIDNPHPPSTETAPIEDINDLCCQSEFEAFIITREL